MGEVHDVTGYHANLALQREAKKKADAAALQAAREKGEFSLELDARQAECLEALTKDPAEVDQIIGQALIVARGIKAFKILWNRV